MEEIMGWVWIIGWPTACCGLPDYNSSNGPGLIKVLYVSQIPRFSYRSTFSQSVEGIGIMKGSHPKQWVNGLSVFRDYIISRNRNPIYRN